MDLFIKNECNTLTCDDAFQMYYHMFYPLRVFRGNSTGFTGYAEFIIFRTLWHVLGGDFEVDPPDSDLGVCRRTSAARNEMAIPLSNSYGYPTLP